MEELSKREFSKRRKEMVENAIFARVLDAMRTVPREAFLPERLREFAYEDSPLPIEEGQTISQPYIVAFTVVRKSGEREQRDDDFSLMVCLVKPGTPARGCGHPSGHSG